VALKRRGSGRPVVHLALLLATAFTLSACGKPARTPEEVAQRVMENSAWVDEALACPADVMATEEPLSLDLSPGNCEGKRIGQCLRFCRIDHVGACRRLAYELEAREQGKAAEIVFQRSCILGDASGCTNRGAYLKLNKGDDPKIQSCTARTFRRACEAKDPWGCTMYGHAFHDGHGEPQDDAHARQFYEMGCSLSDSSDDPACAAARRSIGEMDAKRGEVEAVPVPAGDSTRR
jgi:hypothetical protein